MKTTFFTLPAILLSTAALAQEAVPINVNLDALKEVTEQAEKQVVKEQVVKEQVTEEQVTEEQVSKEVVKKETVKAAANPCLLYTSPSPRDS